MTRAAGALAGIVGVALAAGPAHAQVSAGSGSGSGSGGTTSTTTAPPPASSAVTGFSPDPIAAADPIVLATGRHDRRRHAHALMLGGAAAMYLSTELLVKDRLAPAQCRWCDPPGFDRRVRDAVVWDDPTIAARLSDGIGLAGQPLVLAGLLLAAAWREGELDKRRAFDDLAPVLEAAFFVTLFDQGFKFTFGRARPLARFADPDREPHLDDNTSFFSGHAAFTFSIAVAAGTVAHRRGYALEPVIWVTGLSVATATAYLRMGADKHYLSDVTVGAAVGAAFGYVAPRVFHIDTLYRSHGDRLVLVPTGRGLALSGRF